MDKLWILTEERPRFSVILQIMELYCKDFDDTIKLTGDIKIKAIIENGIFQFRYVVEGVRLGKADEVVIKTVSGSSSFLDFLVYKQSKVPDEVNPGNLLMAVEETKTSDDESRNTGVYQRGSKFVYIDHFYNDVNLYMLYNDELSIREEKKPSDTSIFGTNIFLTTGVEIAGKAIDRWFKPFKSIEEMVEFKNNMKKPPAGNVPIDVNVYRDRIEISGLLSKPSTKGNIGHDPSIGALSMISKGLRTLGWKKDIVITKHGVIQSYVDKTKGKNKFLYISHILDLRLEGITMPEKVELPGQYWHYDVKSEKMATVLLHVLGDYNGHIGIYHNHAGCERGYFKTKDEQLIALPKKDKAGINLYLPDLILYDPLTKEIALIEGKQTSKLQDGIKELKLYDSIEDEYIKPHYPDCSIKRFVCIYGGLKTGIPHPDVLLHLNEKGEIFINDNAPKFIKEMFLKAGGYHNNS